MRRLFRYHGAPLNLPPRYNVAPTQDVPVVTLEDGERRLRMMRWGLVPSWWKKDLKDLPSTINARAETVHEKPMFRAAFRARRCLVPADGFYEWQRTGSGPKQPWRIHMKDGEPFAFAGLWERNEQATGEPLLSCTILVTEPNALARRIHNRMPSILAPEDYGAWLDTEATDRDAALRLARAPYPAEAMAAYKVSTTVNSVKNTGPECIEPLEEAA